MSNLILPAKHPIAVRQREPNLLVPGKKPVGDVEIDFSHPLAKGLKGLFVATQGAKNLVSGEIMSPTAISGGTASPTFSGGVASFSGSIITDIIGNLSPDTSTAIHAPFRCGLTTVHGPMVLSGSTGVQRLFLSVEIKLYIANIFIIREFHDK